MLYVIAVILVLILVPILMVLIQIRELVRAIYAISRDQAIIHR